MTFIYVFLVLIILISILLIIYTINYNKIKKSILRLNESESVIDNNLRKKYDILKSIVNIISNEINIEEKVFKDINNLKDKNLSSFDIDRKLTEYHNLVIQVKDDYKELEDNKELKKIILEIENIDETLESSKMFYNKYSTEINKLIITFPGNIVSKLNKIKTYPFFDGKDMFDEILNDFKL